MRRLLLVAIGALIATALTLRADTVALRSAVRLADPGAPVTLGMVADLDGSDAARFKNLVLVANPSQDAGRDGELTLDVARVRAALDAARVNWARIMLSGSKSVIRLPRAAAPTLTAEPTPETSDYEIVDTTALPTVRVAVAQALADRFGVEPGSLKIRFDPGDAPLLAMHADGRRIDARPIASDISTKAPVAATVYERDRIVASGTVRAEVLLSRDGVTLTRAIRKGGQIGPDDAKPERVWVAPGFSPSPPVEVFGATARQRLTPGQIVRADDLESPVVIRKGDLVVAHCMSGAVVVKTPARAMADARLGELVECRVERSKKSFVARADARGRVVIEAANHEPEARDEGDLTLAPQGEAVDGLEGEIR